MRMRRRKNLHQRIERASSVLVKEPQANKGQWCRALPGYREVFIELGCGRGKFTAETAQAMPDIALIAIERKKDALVTAMERAVLAEVRNLRFVCADVFFIDELFKPGEIDRIYINFCDPWPGKRHEKRRLTAPEFLGRYRSVLKQNGEIYFKTDNRELFDYTIYTMNKNGFLLAGISENLHENGVNGIMTDYEEKFHREGKPIYMLIARNSAGTGKIHTTIGEAAE